MIVVDTSIWIDFFRNDLQESELLINLIETRQVIMLDCIAGELLQGSKNKREKEIIIEYWENLPKINYNNLWIEAGIYSSLNKLIDNGIGLIDTVIIVACKKSNSKLWTKDKKILTNISKEFIYI